MIPQPLDALRSLMKKNKIHAYWIPGTDAHQSEYVPALWRRRQWISQFDGSAGDVLILEKEAGLWTDSRYFIQAEQQLQGTGITLYKMGVSGTPSLLEFIKDKLKNGQYLGLDPKLHSYGEAQLIEKELSERGLKIKYMENNLIDALWEDQPSLPDAEIMAWPDEFSGESVESKLNRIRKAMEKENVTAHVLTTLDAIAWTFNIRSSDVDYNPVVISNAIITEKSALLFVNKKKITRKIKKHFKGLVKVYDYDDFKKYLLKQAKRKNKIWLDAQTVNQWIINAIRKKCHIYFKESPVTLFKACKNKTELEGFRNAHIRDGAAMVQFLCWLEQNIENTKITEISAAQKLTELRAEQKHFVGPSFGTISAYKGHGAIVHYESSKETDTELKREGIYLIDSGGQYFDGTTDITRTVALGAPTEEQITRFTQVLQGHIEVATASFPAGTKGIQLDTLARKALWDEGQNYGHGTGHGVGAFLNVHEGPQAISYYRSINVPLQIGMILSNEPGFYKTGEYGIRIETLVNVVKDEANSGAEWEFYKFDTATLCPIDRKLINKDMLSEKQLDYLNAYHQKIWETLNPLLGEEEQKWLQQATKAL
jgi:Xaa-Pro aminopeptidase